MKIAGASRRAGGNLYAQGGFTLIEIMLVVLILGIVMGAGIPSIMSAARKEGIRKAVSDTVAACEKARAQAIISGRTMQVHFRPQDGTISVESSGSGEATAAPTEQGAVAAPAPVSGFSETLPENIAFEMLDINLIEYNAAEDAVVRFFPDGRCDEMVAILVSDKNERRAITLEITTSLATVYDDPRKLLLK